MPVNTRGLHVQKGQKQRTCFGEHTNQTKRNKGEIQRNDGRFPSGRRPRGGKVSNNRVRQRLNKQRVEAGLEPIPAEDPTDDTVYRKRLQSRKVHSGKRVRFIGIEDSVAFEAVLEVERGK